MRFSRGNLTVLAVAVLVGIIYVLPSLLMPLELGDGYRGVIFSDGDINHYLSTVKEVQEGHTWRASTYLYEYKNQNSFLYQYSEVFIGFIARWLGLSVPVLFVFLRFILGSVVFLLFYFLSSGLFRSKKAAIVSGLAIMLGINLLGMYRDPATILKTIFWSGNISSFITYSRLLNPLFTFIFFTGGLLSLFRLFTNDSGRWTVICGIMLGLNFYMYLYFWTYLLVIYGLLAFYAVFIKDRSLFIRLLKSLALGIFIGLPFIFGAVSQLTGNGVDLTEGALRFAISTHEPIVDNVVLLTFLAFLAFLYLKNRRGDKTKSGEIFILTLLLGAMTVSNQQVITGVEIQHHHYYWFTNPISMYLALVYMLFYSLKTYIMNKITAGFLYVGLAGFLLLFGLGVQVSSYKNNFETFRYYQNYGYIFNWLNENSEPEEVVLSNDIISCMIPIYTSNNVYYCESASTYWTTPKARRIHSYYVYHFLNHRDKDIEKTFSEERGTMGRWIYEGQYYSQLCGSDSCFPDEEFSELIIGYREFLKEPFRQQLIKFRLDYIVWDKSIDPAWSIEKFNFLHPAYSYKDIVVYEVR